MPYQVCIIEGNVGKEPDNKFLANGKAISNFSVAVQDGKEHTEWFRVSAYERQSDIVRDYVVKGDRILVEGRLRTREWEDKDGGKRQTTELIANRINLLGNKRKADADGDI
jgi:single-strand DNA-binding protein